MSQLLQRLLYTTVFIVGLSALVIEIVGTRILTPFYGSTIFVWSAMISVTLGCAAAGYFMGGRWADRWPEVGRVFLLVAAAGGSLLMLLQYKKFVLLFADQAGLQYGPLIAALLLFGASFFFLGTVDPYVIRVISRATATAGGDSGRIFALATAGSLIGALLAGYVIIPRWPVSFILQGLGASLVLLGLVGWGLTRQGKPTFLGWFLVLALGGLVLKESSVWPLNFDHDGVFQKEIVYGVTTFGGRYEVIGLPNKRDGQLCLLIDATNQGCIDPRQRNAASPYRKIAAVFDQLPAGAKVLVLGSGAGEYFHQWARDDLHYVLVDINPHAAQVLQAAGVHLDPNHYQLVIADARSYLRETDETYDLIWNDLLGNAVPVSHMVTEESLALTRSRLKPGGVFVSNIIGQTAGENQFVNNVLTTMESVFPGSVYLATDAPHQFFSYVALLATTTPEWPLPRVNEVIAKQSMALRLPEGSFVRPSVAGTRISDDHNGTEYWWAEELRASETPRSFRLRFKRLAASDFK